MNKWDFLPIPIAFVISLIIGFAVALLCRDFLHMDAYKACEYALWTYLVSFVAILVGDLVRKGKVKKAEKQ